MQQVNEGTGVEAAVLSECIEPSLKRGLIQHTSFSLKGSCVWSRTRVWPWLVIFNRWSNLMNRRLANRKRPYVTLDLAVSFLTLLLSTRRMNGIISWFDPEVKVKRSMLHFRGSSMGCEGLSRGLLGYWHVTQLQTDYFDAAQPIEDSSRITAVCFCHMGVGVYNI